MQFSSDYKNRKVYFIIGLVLVVVIVSSVLEILIG
jgi:hypothetical protein